MEPVNRVAIRIDLRRVETTIPLRPGWREPVGNRGVPMAIVRPHAWLLPLLILAAASSVGCASTRDQRGAYLQVIRADQRPPLVGARAEADSLFGLAGECERGD